MIIDYLDRSLPADLEVDLCVLGTGPAGISIARSFLQSPLRVCLVESGGFQSEGQTQQLCEGTSVGDLPFDAATTRMRAFGGSSNVWGGGCIPLRSADLRARAWVPHSGWPLSYAELSPYYLRAKAACGIESHDVADGTFLTAPTLAPVAFESGALVNQVFVRSPVYFGATYRRELQQASNITILLHANLLELLPAADGARISQASIGSIDGRRGVIRAKKFVLACGGIENARLLLLSSSINPAGLGNRHDLVGRYFMDHPSGKLGTLSSGSPNGLTQPYNRYRSKGQGPAHPELCLSDGVLEAQRLLGGRVRPVAVEAPVPRGIRALRELRTSFSSFSRSRDESMALDGRMASSASQETPVNAKSPARLAMLGVQAVMGLGDIANAFARRRAGEPVVRTQHVDLVGYFEQAPNPASRITLGAEKDLFGQRKVCVDWRFTALDWHTYRTAGALFGTELARACRAVYHPAPWLSQQGGPPEVCGTSHHMGTTRMSDDPRQGVVDHQCKVHGIDNLYVVGSSVFPTGGWAFPTFTIVALSLRLAEHLKSLMMFI